MTWLSLDIVLISRNGVLIELNENRVSRQDMKKIRVTKVIVGVYIYTHPEDIIWTLQNFIIFMFLSYPN